MHAIVGGGLAVCVGVSVGSGVIDWSGLALGDLDSDSVFVTGGATNCVNTDSAHVGATAGSIVTTVMDVMPHTFPVFSPSPLSSGLPNNEFAMKSAPAAVDGPKSRLSLFPQKVELDNPSVGPLAIVTVHVDPGERIFPKKNPLVMTLSAVDKRLIPVEPVPAEIQTSDASKEAVPLITIPKQVLDSHAVQFVERTASGAVDAIVPPSGTVFPFRSAHPNRVHSRIIRS
jgi:hypothetical protein